MGDRATRYLDALVKKGYFTESIGGNEMFIGPLMLNHVPPDAQSIREIGAATGLWMQQVLKARRAIRDVTIVEFSDAAEECRRRLTPLLSGRPNSRLEVIQADFLQVAERLRPAQVVASSYVAEYMDDTPAYIRRLHDLTEPGGRAILLDVLTDPENTKGGVAFKVLLRSQKQASEKEARMGELQEARQHGGQAQLLVGTLPDSPLRRRLHIDILLRLVQLTLRTELPHDNLARLGEAQGLLSSLSGEADSQHADERRHAWIDFLYGRVFHYQGSVTEALRFYHRVLPAAESLGDEQILATASMYLGAALMLQGKSGQCQPFLERSAALEDRLDSADERIRALGYYAMSLVGMGRYKDGMALPEQALAYAAKSARPALLTISHLHLCISTAVCGDFSTLLTRAQLGMAHAQKSGEKLYHHSMLSLLGWAHSFHGNFQEALTCRAEARAVEQELGGQILLSD